MGWFIKFLTSSIGQKIIMSLTGLFLISFLLIHLIGNLKLLLSDGGIKFNEYAYFMTHNPFIKTISYLLYLSILLHAIQGWALWRKNKAARGPQRYAVQVTRTTGTSAFASKSMGWLGTIVFIFILIHLYQFWLQMKLGNLPMMDIKGEQYKDLYAIVNDAYANFGYVVFYVLSMVVIGYHLLHGFQSAFQTLGLHHRKYTPTIKLVGRIYAILIPFGFALIPIVMYGKHAGWW